MKAKLTYHFVCEKDWEVVSNTYVHNQFDIDNSNEHLFVTEFEKEIYKSFSKEFSNKQKYIKFLQTQLLSTYLFCFVAGEYVYQYYDDKNKDLSFPLRIYYDKEL